VWTIKASLGGGATTLGGGTAISGSGTPDTGCGTPFRLNLNTARNTTEREECAAILYHAIITPRSECTVNNSRSQVNQSINQSFIHSSISVQIQS